jgi:hypothetical protein
MTDVVGQSPHIVGDAGEERSQHPAAKCRKKGRILGKTQDPFSKGSPSATAKQA